jgi:transcriptional regulator with XRE-family HTH domain
MPVYDPRSALNASAAAGTTSQGERKRLHRIAVVRQQQGVSLRTAARQMGENASKLRSEEEESTDLTLSQLYAWQQVLDVPLSDLLVESEGPLSRPVMHRAQMLRLMKTAAALRDAAKDSGVRRMAENLINQLIEMMPELRNIGPWPSVGQRRSTDEYGAAYERRLADESFGGAGCD